MKLEQTNERGKMLKQHQTELKRLSQNHKNELDQIRNIQQKQKGEMQLAHKTELSTIQNSHDQKLHGQLNRNEEILGKVKENLEKVKETTAMEQRKIQEDHLLSKEEKKQLHAQEINNARMKTDLILNDMNQEANLELQKLQREAQQNESEIRRSHLSETMSMKDSHLKNKVMAKDQYQKEQMHEQDKFQSALLKQKTDHTQHLASEERKHQSTIENRKGQFQKEIMTIEDDGMKKKEAKKKKFEKDYGVMNKKQETILRNLVGKKEDLIHDLKSSLIKEYKLGMTKFEDPFYGFGKIDSQVVENEDKSGYTVKVPMAEHEASNVDMRAEGRELRLTFQRKFEFEKTDNNSNDKVSKVESFVSKLNVGNIVDPKTIEKSYQEGHVVFKIKNA